MLGLKCGTKYDARTCKFIKDILEHMSCNVLPHEMKECTASNSEIGKELLNFIKSLS